MIGFIEAPLTFFKIPIQTCFADAVEAAQVAPRFIPIVLNPIDMVTAFRENSLAGLDRRMVPLGDIDHVFGVRVTRVDDAVGARTILHDREEGLDGCIGNDRCIDSAASHEQSKDKHLS